MTDRDVQGFRVRLGLAYDLEHHMWVEILDPRRVRIGMDPLGVETSGTLAQLALAAPGAEVRRGAAFGSLEAEKFVGPLVSPLTGSVVAGNEAVPADPGLVEKDPYAAWLLELVPHALEAELEFLAHEEDDLLARFAARIVQYRIEGVLAE